MIFKSLAISNVACLAFIKTVLIFTGEKFNIIKRTLFGKEKKQK